ncbi:hypothetical protein H0H87_000011 [Tephrocybe sp. NHM501043]|nr:hypothetical protein H0H87_000011 [Tephrocybe sp. NHM501043]
MPSVQPLDQQPLPPLPAPPPALSQKHPLKSSTDQSQWEERIKQNVTLRQQLTQVEADIANHNLLTNTFSYLAVPEDGKANINNELAQLAHKREEIKKQREDALDRLMKADSWPAMPLTDAQDGELNKYADMLKDVAQLKEQVDVINTTIAKLRSHNDTDEDAMHVDTQEGPSSHPFKQRRDAGPDVPVEPEPGPTTQELEDMRDKLTDLDSRFVTFLNDLTIQDSDIRGNVQLQIDNALEEYANELEARPPLGEDVYKEVKTNIDTIGDEVEELADEVGKLLVTVDEQKLEMDNIKTRIAASREQYGEMQKKFQLFQESREKDRRTISALEQAIEAYTRVSAPSPVPGLTHDQLVELLEEPLQDSVRTQMQPLIEALRGQVQDMLKTQNAAMYKSLWSKLALTLRMVESISKRLERIDRTAAATATTAAASAATAAALTASSSVIVG